MARIEVKSEITGTLWKLTSQVGDTVEEGAVLMIVESMKMEQSLSLLPLVRRWSAHTPGSPLKKRSHISSANLKR